MNFDELMEAYQLSGTIPLDGWATEDLVELEALVNAEIQDRYRRDQDDYFGQY